jgi:hypothetical protein
VVYILGVRNYIIKSSIYLKVGISMKNLLTVLALGGVGWIFWEAVTKEMWIEIAKWVGTGLVVLIVLAIMIRVIRDKAEQREADRQMGKVSKIRSKQVPIHPQIMYLPQTVAAPSYPVENKPPAGLVDLPLDKYEWEI